MFWEAYMKKKVLMLLSILTLFLFAEEKAITLQNGNNNYTGTTDQWARDNYGTSWNVEYDSTLLFVRNNKAG